MKLILGKRDYEKTQTGKYPKYNLEQMNLYVIPDCNAYTGIQLICNIKSFDLFGKYQNELSKENRQIIDKKIESEYGIHNVCFDDIIDFDKFNYNGKTQQFEENKK